MEPRQSDGSDRWFNRVYHPEAGEPSLPLPPLPHPRNLGTSGARLTRENPFSTTLRAKRQIESTPAWPKRHKKTGQTGSIIRTGASSSSLRRLESPYQVEGYPFPNHPNNRVEAAFPSTHTGPYHDNIWHQPTPPITDLGAPEASPPSKVDGYYFNNPLPSTASFTHHTHDQPSYQPSHSLEPNETFPYSQSRYANDEPQLSLQCGSSVPAASLNHIPTVKQHSYFTPSPDDHDQAVHNLQTAPRNNVILKPLNTEQDDYFVGQSDEEEMALLADSAPATTHQIPPSSVIRDMDADSTIEVFDPSLQRSSPRNGPEHGDDGTGKDETHFQDEDLLSSDVDWDSIFESVPPHSKSIPPRDAAVETRPNGGKESLTAGIRTGSCGRSGISGRIQSTRGLPPKSPTFPKSTSTGLSNRSKMRTFFRVGELVNEGKRCFYSNKQATFELYAWVTHSWRESPQVQHFQFMDIFKEQRQDLRGTLSGWRDGEVLDVQSSAFLYADDKVNPKLCRCVCRLLQDHKVGMGWVLGVIWIREATWEEVSAKEGFTTPTW